MSNDSLALRTEIWNELLTSELNCDYWSALAKRQLRLDTVVKILVTFATSGTVALWAFWKDSTVAWQIASSLSALLAIVHLYTDWQGRAVKCTEIQHEWSEIRVLLENLWLDLNSPGAKVERIQSQFKTLRLRTAAIRISDSSVPYNPRIARRCEVAVAGRRSPAALVSRSQ